MSQEPKAGDRIRLITDDYEPAYRPGDRGRVLSGPLPAPSGGYFYVARMDKDGPAGSGLIVHAGEIEVDHAPRGEGSTAETRGT